MPTNAWKFIECDYIQTYLSVTMISSYYTGSLLC